MDVRGIILCSFRVIYSTSGPNGTWGQNGTTGVLKKKARLAWVYFHVHLISVIIQFSVTHRNQTCQKKPRFEYLTKTKFPRLINQFTRVLTSIVLTNSAVQPLHVVKHDHVPLVHIFTPFDSAKGDIMVDKMRFLQI